MKRNLSSAFFFLLLFFCSGTSTGFIWSQKASFSPGSRYAAFHFSIGDYGYVGSGSVQSGTSYTIIDDFWAYNSLNDTWSQRASLPGGARLGAASFTIADKGFVVTGFDFTNYLNDLWEYNSNTNIWTAKAAFPGDPRYSCASFSVNEYGFVGMGKSGGYFSDFFRYDVVQDLWTAIAPVPGTARQAAKGFCIDGYGYVVGGAVQSPAYNCYDTYRYDPIGDSWLEVAGYPGGGSHGFAGFVLNDIAYIGTGTTVSATNPVFNDLWSYEPGPDLWTQVPDFTGGVRQGSASMAIGNKGYLGLGSDVIFPALNYHSDWWSFDEPTGVLEIHNNHGIVSWFDEQNILHISMHESLLTVHKLHIFNTAGQLIKSLHWLPGQKEKIVGITMHSNGVYYYSIKGATINWSGKVALIN